MSKLKYFHVPQFKVEKKCEILNSFVQTGTPTATVQKKKN